MGGWLWEDAQELPAGLMPVVPFLNRPDLYGATQGEFETHVGHLERINYVLLNRLEIATLQAFRQRALKGVPNEDEFGQPIDYDDVFAADPGSLWLLPETAELWESGQVDLTGTLAAARDDIEQLAAVTRTPMHYFAPASANQSAEGASLARESLMFKVRDNLRQTGESWEAVMCTAFAFAGDEERSRRGDMEVIWADPERHSLAEKADASGKALSTGGLTWRAVMEDIWQKTPQEIDRMEAERMNDAMLNEIFAAPSEFTGGGEEEPEEEPAEEEEEPVAGE
jgi:Phage portal protein, SPP1 Gp6-like